MKRGEVATGIVLWGGGISIGIVLSLIGAVYAGLTKNQDEAKATASELRAVDASTLQRVAILEEAVKTIKTDTSETRKDVKEILQAVK